ncbi:MAG TPA: DOMON-like domain-containing protein [Caulobacterales bacterium]|nr:DOMON-like domain-containing protein [Caulobacterales bacterium]
MALKIHPDSRCDAVSAIAVEIARLASGRLRLRYEVTGHAHALNLPAETNPGRADGLWKQTCFEAFAARDSGGYDEFNFSPSLRWAGYRFESLRTGMRNIEMTPPEIITRRSASAFTLEASLDFPEGDRLGLSAVIEEASGEKSYWALAHPAEKPDFHHPGSFTIDLGTI